MAGRRWQAEGGRQKVAGRKWQAEGGRNASSKTDNPTLVRQEDKNTSWQVRVQRWAANRQA